MEHNVLTGTTSARLHKLILKNQQGSYQNILDLMATSQALMQIYVGGVLYSSATALNFANASHILDPVTGIMNIGAPLYQGFVRIGTSTTYTDLTRGSAGELLWDGNQVALAGSGGSSLDLYVNGSLVSPAATGLNFSNHSNSLDPNTGILTLGPVLSQTLLRLGTNAVYGDLTRGSGGELLWDGGAMASEALVTQVQNDLQINLDATVAYWQTNFQEKLATVSEATTDAVILQSLDASDLHIAWYRAANASYVNQTGYQTITQGSTARHIFTSVAAQVPGGTFRFSIELMAGTMNNVVIQLSDGTTSDVFLQTMTNNFQTITRDLQITTSLPTLSIVIGPQRGDFPQQTSGTFYIRNVRVTQDDTEARISRNLVVTGSCTAQAFVTSSDERIKGDVQSVDPTTCLQIVKSIPPKIYTRTDLGESEEDPERRIGVIAQDVAKALPAEWKNVVFYQDKSLAVDYSRLSALLLGAVQSLSTRLEALEANLP
jgi:hypothetical protein